MSYFAPGPAFSAKRDNIKTAGYAARSMPAPRSRVDRSAIKHDVQSLRQVLLSQHGNLVAGWRNVLDRDGSGSVDREEFLEACRLMGFPGDAQAVFSALAEGDELSLQALDKDSAEALNDLALFIRNEFGTVDEAFKSGITRGAHRPMEIDFPTFMHSCMEMRFRAKNFKHLFQCLDFDNNGYLTLPELRFLERWRAEIFVYIPTLDERLDVALQKHRPLPEICELVELGADPNRIRNPGNAFTDDGNSALGQAAERGTAEDVWRILSCNADPNATNAFGRTPLHGAANRNVGRVDPVDIIRHLYSAQADPNMSTADGVTPLHVACGGGHSGTVAMLAYIGADVHAQDAQQRSPLWLTLLRKSLPSCRALLEFLADPCRRDKGGRSALQYAIRTRQEVLVEILQAHVQDNYEVILKAAAQDLGPAFHEEPYIELLEDVPPARLAQVLWTLDCYSQQYCK